MVEESEALRVLLADRDVPCPKCRYNLRGLNGEVCPECGSKVSVGVVMKTVGTFAESRWVRVASSPRLILAAAMLLGTGVRGWRGAGTVLVVWTAWVAGLALMRRARLYCRKPLEASGDWLWRAFVIAAGCVAWAGVSFGAIVWVTGL